MPKLHISQDDTGFWQMAFEDDEGNLTLVSHQFPSPDHLVEDARELVATGKVPNAAIVIGAPRPAATARSAARPYVKPAPRRAVD